jgi:hypothetical protein
MPDTPQRQRFLSALDQLDDALVDNLERNARVRERVRAFRSELANGRTVSEFVVAEAAPRTVEILSTNLAVLETIGADFRIQLAHELRRDGLTIEAIADLFGVTRQRVSALLRQRPELTMVDPPTGQRT